MKTALKTEARVATDALRVIYERRATRSFSEKEIEREIIEQIVDAGRMAPSAFNRQPWKFYVLTDVGLISELSKQISKSAIRSLVRQGTKHVLKAGLQFLTHLPHSIHMITGEDPIFYNAPVVVFITAPPKDEWAPLDIGMCAENMMLAAKALGVDSCPLGFARFVARTEAYPKLRIPQSEEVYLAIIFGYGRKQLRAPDRVKNNLIYIS